MTYVYAGTRVSTISWPGQSVSSLQFSRRQDVYKTVPGTSRGETPYNNDTSSYYKWQRYTKTGATPLAYPTCTGTGTQNINGSVKGDVFGLRPRALNRARQSFIQDCRENRESSIGSSLGEMDRTLRMIGDRAKQLLGFARSLKAGRFRRAASYLYLDVPRGWREKGKSLGDLWLEFHFGWKPLLGDIHDGMKLISEPLSNDGPCRGRGRAKELKGKTLVYSFSDASSQQKKYLSGSFEALAELRGKTRLTNPNLDLLQNLGLANPMSIAWELFPFSFLVDHVAGVGDFLNSFSDELGWECYGVAQSTLSLCRDGWERSEIWNAAGTELIRSYDVNGNSALMTRGVPGALPPYTLTYTNPFTGLSAPRAATYIALLLQAMKPSGS